MRTKSRVASCRGTSLRYRPRLCTVERLTQHGAIAITALPRYHHPGFRFSRVYIARRAIHHARGALDSIGQHGSRINYSWRASGVIKSRVGETTRLGDATFFSAKRRENKFNESRAHKSTLISCIHFSGHVHTHTHTFASACPYRIYLLRFIAR